MDLTTNEYYKTEIEKYQTAIRKHRDQKGDNRCWMDDEELYSVLPEGYIRPERDSCVELELCKKFIATRHNPNISYVSPEIEIEKLKSDLEKMTNYNFLYSGWAEKNKNYKDGYVLHYFKLWKMYFVLHNCMTKCDQEQILKWHDDWKKNRIKI